MRPGYILLSDNPEVNFNPRTAWAMRHKGPVTRFSKLEISIHAPRERCDKIRYAHICVKRYFNPRTALSLIHICRFSSRSNKSALSLNSIRLVILLPQLTNTASPKVRPCLLINHFSALIAFWEDSYPILIDSSGFTNRPRYVKPWESLDAVSYTHLDVYKRQCHYRGHFNPRIVRKRCDSINPLHRTIQSISIHASYANDAKMCIRDRAKHQGQADGRHNDAEMIHNDIYTHPRFPPNPRGVSRFWSQSTNAPRLKMCIRDRLSVSPDGI